MDVRSASLRPVLLPLPARIVLGAVAVASLGLAGWVPPLVGATTAVVGPIRTRMRQALALTAGLVVLGVVLLGSVDKNHQDGSVRNSVGIVMLLTAMAVGAFCAFYVPRKMPTQATAELPGVQQALARRELRQQYKELTAQDPVVAIELGVGRPDRPRQIDDGGLVDLNALDATSLQQCARLSSAEAQQVLVARDRSGRLSNVDELVVYSDLRSDVADRLREYAVFMI